MTEKERDMMRVNDAYMSEDYDLYEDLIERYARKHGVEAWQFEDDCTDARILGIGRC